jgi:hypothetical protein
MRKSTINAWRFVNESVALNTDDCVEWPGFASHFRGRTGTWARWDYPKLAFNGKHEKVARIVFELKYGRPPIGVTRHTCDRPPCVNWKHIIEGSQAQNVRDQIERGSRPRGADITQAKLTDEMVVEIRDAYRGRGRLNSARPSYATLAQRYDVSITTVSDIVNGKIWRHVA